MFCQLVFQSTIRFAAQFNCVRPYSSIRENHVEDDTHFAAMRIPFCAKGIALTFRLTSYRRRVVAISSK